MESNAGGQTITPERFRAKVEMSSGLAKELDVLNTPDLRVVVGNGERDLYSRDQADVPQLLKDVLIQYTPDAVAQPFTSEAAMAVLEFAKARGLAVIPRGSGSSPFGGSIPVNGGIVVDVGNLDKVLDVDVKNKRVRVQGGCRWADVDHALPQHGLRIISCPSSRFSTVAGWICGGGLGVGSLGGGHLSRIVTSVKLATPGGIITLQPPQEEFQAVFGSEGQLGVIVEATLKVKEIDRASRSHLLLFHDLDAAVEAAERLRRLSPLPEDLIYFSPGKLRYANKLLHGEHFGEGHALLVTSADAASEKAVVDLLSSLGIKEEPAYQARLLWHERSFPMKLRRLGPGMLGAEVLAPMSNLKAILHRAEDLCQEFDLDPLLEVHFMQGRESLLLCYYLTDQVNQSLYTLDAAKSMVVTSSLIGLGARPYSLGVWNNSFADHWPEEERERLRKAKDKLDPTNVMNPGKYFALKGRMFGAAGLVFSPLGSGTGFRFMARLHAPLGLVFRSLSSVSRKAMGPRKRDVLVEMANQCAMCGACVSVCPAYALTKDERVTARGKLLTAKAMAEGKEITKEHAHRAFLCMRCKACEQVCQSKLDLIPAYEELEARLEKKYGKDAVEIERFVRLAEVSPHYEEMISRGLVLGAPKNGMGGERRV
ncbi:MAG: FAD-binding protein [Methanomassiliicoccales archaeon]|nr:FAD-binding protein [Methanomassiliicoccales archaeon]